MSYFKNVQIRDQYGFTGDATPSSGIITVPKVKLVGELFDGATIDTNFWTASAAVGTVTQVASEMVLTSGTASTNNARLFTVQRALWVSETSNKFRTQMRIASSDDDVTLRMGMGWGASMPTVTDGCYFKIVGSTISINTMFNTVETSVASGSFNGTYTAPTLTNNNVFEILATLGKVYFLIGNVLVHTATFSTAGWFSGSANFHVFADVVNTGVSAAIAYTFRTLSIARLGEETSTPTYKQISTATTTICKYGAGILHAIIVNNPTNNAITFYDNIAASGSVIAIINPGSSATPFELDYHCPFYNGLTIVTAGTPNLTIIYE